MLQYMDIYQHVKEWVLEAGELLEQSLSDEVPVAYKSSVTDLVTEMDKRIERYFINKIIAHYPDHYIIGEETSELDQKTRYDNKIVWLIDPIDGTSSYVHQKENFAISVAVYENGKPVIGVIYDPVRKELFHALIHNGAYLNEKKLDKIQQSHIHESLIGMDSNWLVPNQTVNYKTLHPLVQDLLGTRIIGCAALELAAVACGRLNGFISFRLSPWDYAAGVVLLIETEALVSTAEGESLNIFEPSSSVLAANKSLYSKIAEEYLNKKD